MKVPSFFSLILIKWIMIINLQIIVVSLFSILKIDFLILPNTISLVYPILFLHHRQYSYFQILISFLNLLNFHILIPFSLLIPFSIIWIFPQIFHLITQFVCLPIVLEISSQFLISKIINFAMSISNSFHIILILISILPPTHSIYAIFADILISNFRCFI